MLRSIFSLVTITYLFREAKIFYVQIHAWLQATIATISSNPIYQQAVNIINEYGALGYYYIAGGIFAMFITTALVLGIVRRTINYGLNIIANAYRVGAGQSSHSRS